MSNIHDVFFGSESRIGNSRIFSVCLPIVIFLLFAQAVLAQEDYQKWLNGQNKEYNQFVSKQDKEFIGFLKENWESFHANKGIEPFRTPKPSEPVVVLPKQKVPQPVEVPVQLKNVGGHEGLEKTPVKEAPSAAAAEHPPANVENHAIPKANIPKERENIGANKTPNMPATSGISAASSVFEVDYFNRELRLPHNESMSVPVGDTISPDVIAHYWRRLCESDYQGIVDSAEGLRRSLDLNDWGYCKLLYDVAQKIDHDQTNEAYLLTWFMLVKSGYQARVGYRGDRVYLLISTGNELFGIPYFFFHNTKEKYYVLLLSHAEKEPQGAIYSYMNDYPGELHKLSFDFTALPRLGDAVGRREINFQYCGKKYSFLADYNEGLIEFYRYYPNTDLCVYFHSQLSNQARTSLLPALDSAIHAMKQRNAVDFLLHFVQDATGYETDQKQFGYDKSFFPEESLYYHYSDCEDRAIFFSYLVSHLVGLKVIGLKYPGHLSAAVEFTTNVSGDYVIYNSHKYIICDPTYFGSVVGQSMPRYKKVAAEIIE